MFYILFQHINYMLCLFIIHLLCSYYILCVSTIFCTYDVYDSSNLLRPGRYQTFHWLIHYVPCIWVLVVMFLNCEWLPFPIPHLPIPPFPMSLLYTTFVTFICHLSPWHPFHATFTMWPFPMVLLPMSPLTHVTFSNATSFYVTFFPCHF